MTEMEELQAWAAKWLGDREIPQEFLQLTAIQNARLKGGHERAALEAARPTEADGENAEKFLEYMQDFSDPLHCLGIKILGPESARGDGLARAVLDDEANAEVPHLAALLSYFLPAAETKNDLVYGYWLYPGEVWPPPVVYIDTEATFFTERGRTLAEALLADCWDDAAVALLGQWFADLGLPVTVRANAEIPDSPVRMDPQVLESEL
ncbi:hypothetical protein [Streptomyces sp. GC420]|uniref:hypothetical protein n=1 Tax=Streptomyces sp. GC420 TaxID=2697568 RepID=UPI001415160A|nr:hypothetical protein [Streptomyces sp. GC420]NBM14507.1 hypothetical protein [Streptomyces sp. GC420]